MYRYTHHRHHRSYVSVNTAPPFHKKSGGGGGGGVGGTWRRLANLLLFNTAHHILPRMFNILVQLSHPRIASTFFLKRSISACNFSQSIFSSSPGPAAAVSYLFLSLAAAAASRRCPPEFPIPWFKPCQLVLYTGLNVLVK